jgi:hypothetical protein
MAIPTLAEVIEALEALRVTTPDAQVTEVTQYRGDPVIVNIDPRKTTHEWFTTISIKVIK